MKKLLLIAALALAPVFAGAQLPIEVVKFLGIPVDGTKEEMIQQLKEKGFRPDPESDDDALFGEFNGMDVKIFVQTNKGKVRRIIVGNNSFFDEATIKITYNNLCSQFEKHNKYISASETEQTIPDDEDISYEMSVHKKQYQAVFYQIPELAYSLLKETLPNNANTKDYIKALDLLKEEGNTVAEQMLRGVLLNAMKNQVWFTFNKLVYGKYVIAIYYENGYNTANGEDL